MTSILRESAGADTFVVNRSGVPESIDTPEELYEIVLSGYEVHAVVDADVVAEARYEDGAIVLLRRDSRDRMVPHRTTIEHTNAQHFAMLWIGFVRVATATRIKRRAIA